MVDRGVSFLMPVNEAILALSEGNPGAVQACEQIVINGYLIDPSDCHGDIWNLIILDNLSIHGAKIFKFYHDVCKEDVGKMLAVLRAYQWGNLLGHDCWQECAYLTKELIHSAIDNWGEGLDLDSIVAAVKARRPDFRPDLRVPEHLR